jgi:beta-1,4-mannosyltransferase
MEVCVIVLGDLARSPRMLNHVHSLISQGFKVNLIGYHDSFISADLTSSPRLKIISLQNQRLNDLKKLSKRFFVLYAGVRIFSESLQLFYVLVKSFNSKVFLIQNPPSMPVLAVAYFVSCFYGTDLVIDWHNYAWSILKLSGKGRVIVGLAYYYEKIFGILADKSFCVSECMKKDLSSNNIKSITLYDRPFPKKSSSKDMRKELGIPNDYFFIVSSTSWTIDEDFSIIIDALDILTQNSIKIFLLITGKGPMQEYYKGIINTKAWSSIRIKMEWFSLEDYQAVLKQADLGICLHVSSSGLDLPMKVVDMQEAELPALAFKYQTIYELVTQDTGDLFSTPDDLASKILVIYIQGLYNSPGTLKNYKVNLQAFKKNNTWVQEWNTKAFPVFIDRKFIKIRFIVFWVIIFTIVINYNIN